MSAGVVYRVTPQLYGPGASYHCYAGSEASYRLGKSIVGTDGANCEWRGGALSEAEHKALNMWATTFAKKYPVVGWFVDDAEAAATSSLAQPAVEVDEERRRTVLSMLESGALAA